MDARRKFQLIRAVSWTSLAIAVVGVALMVFIRPLVAVGPPYGPCGNSLAGQFLVPISALLEVVALPAGIVAVSLGWRVHPSAWLPGVFAIPASVAGFVAILGLSVFAYGFEC